MSVASGYDPLAIGSLLGAASTSGSSGSGSSQSQQSTQVLPQLMGGYSQLLGMNQQNYGNMMGAYQQQLGSNAQQIPQIANGYGNVQSGIANTLGMGAALGQNGNWGVAQPAATAIQQQGQMNQGQITQQMANAGLGNTTVGANLGSQQSALTQQALGGLGANLASTYAGYQANEGNSALAAQMQGMQTQTGLTQGALNPLNSQYSNTMGNLTGQFGSSSSSSTQKAASQNPQQNPQSGQQSSNGSGVTGGAYTGNGLGGAPTYGGGGSSAGGGITTGGGGTDASSGGTDVNGNPISGAYYSPSGQPTYSNGVPITTQNVTNNSGQPMNPNSPYGLQAPVTQTGGQPPSDNPLSNLNQSQSLQDQMNSQNNAGGNGLGAYDEPGGSSNQAGQITAFDTQSLQQQFQGINDNQVQMMQNAVNNPSTAPVNGYAIGLTNGRAIWDANAQTWNYQPF